MASNTCDNLAFFEDAHAHNLKSFDQAPKNGENANVMHFWPAHKAPCQIGGTYWRGFCDWTNKHAFSKVLSTALSSLHLVVVIIPANIESDLQLTRLSLLHDKEGLRVVTESMFEPNINVVSQ